MKLSMDIDVFADIGLGRECGSKLILDKSLPTFSIPSTSIHNKTQHGYIKTSGIALCEVTCVLQPSSEVIVNPCRYISDYDYAKL